MNPMGQWYPMLKVRPSFGKEKFEGPQAMTWRYVTMPSHRRYCSYGHPSHVCY
nr:hypothetical protein Q903MT_gene1806 [Picea sitchensis]